MPDSQLLKEIHCDQRKLMGQVGKVHTQQAVIVERLDNYGRRMDDIEGDAAEHRKETKPVVQEHQARQVNENRVRRVAAYLGPLSLVSGILIALSRFL